MNRRIRLVPFIVCAMFSLLVVCMGPVLAMEVGPTPFQRAIASWMGVVALVAEEGAEAQQHEHVHRQLGDGEIDLHAVAYFSRMLVISRNCVRARSR